MIAFAGAMRLQAAERQGIKRPIHVYDKSAMGSGNAEIVAGA